jgi:hypothetical protein
MLEDGIVKLDTVIRIVQQMRKRRPFMTAFGK